MAAVHRTGVVTSVTSYHKFTINQIIANQKIEAERYRMVIIMDDDEFDGFNAAREIWSNNLYSNFVILLISSNDQKGNYLKCLDLGIDHYLVKPFDIAELFSAIKSSFKGVEDTIKIQETSKLKESLKILVIEDNLNESENNW